MTNEEAVKFLTRIRRQINYEWVEAHNKKDALNIAIQAVKEQATIQDCKYCDDAVSRKDVVTLIDKATEMYPYKVIGDSDTYSKYNEGWADACNWLYAYIDSDDLPSVQPQRIKGKWLRWTDDFSCDNCSCHQYIETDYCPVCGAEMWGDSE